MSYRQFILVVALTIILALTASQARGYSPAPKTPSFDNDSTADLVVGVPYEDVSVFPDNFTDAGAIHVLYGSTGSGLTGTGDLYWHQGVSGVVDLPEPHERFGRALAIGDFNCDGLDDLAVGLPGQDVFFSGLDRADAGAVHVFYAISDGLTIDGDEIWHQDVGLIGSNPEDGDAFGEALAAGDFNGDNCHDLAVGAPDEDWFETEAGIVQVIYGSELGLTDVGSNLFRQEGGGILETEEEYDRFGEELTTGDFNNDGFVDLAVGVPHEKLGGPPEITSVGLVHIIYGSSAGLTSIGNQIFYQDMFSIVDYGEQGELFGADLVSGDFNNDDYDDLAVGVSGEMVDSQSDAGAVHILYGSSFGITASGDFLLDKGDLGYSPWENGQFGDSLASSDFNRDGYADLAIGSPGDDFGVNHEGIVYVVYGSKAWGSNFIEDFFIQGQGGLLDSPEMGDQFGYALAAGDFNGDGFGDLAAAAPYEDIGSPLMYDEGSVSVIYGSRYGLSTSGNQFWYQGFNGLGGGTENDDHFGIALAAHPYHPQLLYLPLTMR